MSNIVTIISDFGLEDPFVGIMKGVMAGIAPELHFIDLTHNIEPQDLLATYYALKSAHSFFPKGTVHLAVVDPGVGGGRRAMAVESDGCHFVGPDNGIFSFLYDNSRTFKAVELTNENYFHAHVSGTFHGRDIFAPVAAHISKGCPIERFGSVIKSPERLSIPEAVVSEKKIVGEVIYIDKFGNLVTNIQKKIVKNLQVKIRSKEVLFLLNGHEGRIHKAYSCASREEPEELAGTINSWGVLEIFVNHGNAMKVSGARRGSKIEIIPS